jgi:hypothetical protein
MNINILVTDTVSVCFSVLPISTTGADAMPGPIAG